MLGRFEQMARKNDGASANPNTSTAALSNRIRQGDRLAHEADAALG
jgi:hypothetical protein